VALLDTTVLIDLRRNPRNPEHQRARAIVRQLLAVGESLYTSRINEAEFRVGVEAARDRQDELERVEGVLAGVVILEFDAASAKQFAVAKAALRKVGRPTGDCDTMIAAVAMVNRQILITRNPGDF
jgi:tRNA(fMet)-specific endonuclease VapC